MDKLQSASFDGTADDWVNILQYTLVSKFNRQLTSSIRDNLDVTCNKLDKGSRASLVILFRTRVQNITHNLGAIELPETSDQTDDVDLFGWTCQTIEKRDEVEAALATTTSEVKDSKEMIETLQQQLDDLIKAKAEHEDQLLAKFVLLLNEKKLKIRNLQRLVSELDYGNADTVKRSGKKRKAPKTIEAAADNASDESDVFDAVPVGEKQDDPIQDAQQVATPSQDSLTEDGSGNEGSAMKATHLVHDPKADTRDVTPPPRDILFGKPINAPEGLTSSIAAHSHSQTKATAKDEKDDDTASEDDDEL